MRFSLGKRGVALPTQYAKTVLGNKKLFEIGDADQFRNQGKLGPASAQLKEPSPKRKTGVNEHAYE
jgi:hypothetical protein